MLKNKWFIKWLIHLVLIGICHQTCLSQNDTVQIEDLGIETVNSDIHDQVMDRIKTKIKINSKDKMNLLQTPLLNLNQINAIIEHIKIYGIITNPYELQQINELSFDDIQSILPNIDFGLEIKTQVKQILKNEKITHKIIIQEIVKTKLSEGYSTNVASELQFKGSPLASKIRWELSLGKYMNLTVNAGKDPGEKLKNGQIGMSCNIQLNNTIKQIIIGDFQATFGQGTILGSGINIGKSATVMNTMRASSRIRPVRSNSTASHFNGIALKLQYQPHFNHFIFGSNTTVFTDTIHREDKILLRTDHIDGLRRNQKELSSIKRSKSFQTGTYLEWSKHNTNIALGCILNKINTDQFYQPKRSINPFKKNLDSIMIPISFDFKTSKDNCLFYAELGSSHLTSGKGLIFGILNAIDRRTDVSILFRKYANDFSNSLSGAFSESSKKSAETGLYIGLTKKTGKSTKLNAYLDLFTLKQSSYNNDWPSGGLECLSEFIHAKKNGPEVKMRIGFKNHSENEKGNQILNRMDQIHTSSFRLDFAIPLSKNHSLHSRVEVKTVKSKLGISQTGYLIYHHINGTIKRNLKFKIRGMVFNCPHYDSRIFVYENDISNTFSIKAFQNTGSHFFLLLQTKLRKNIQIKLRFAHTKFHDINVIGSGIDQIHSNRQNEIKIELGTSI